MKKIGVVVFLGYLISGCASVQPSVPDDYQGPVATVQDTATGLDDGKANLFYLHSIDGEKIKDSCMESQGASVGQGNHLATVLLKNTVSASQHAFTVVGRTVYAMPMRAMIGPVYQVKGDVAFTPEADQRYIVKGTLSEAQTVVWLENAATGEIIKKIEVEPAVAKRGFFQR